VGNSSLHCEKFLRRMMSEVLPVFVSLPSRYLSRRGHDDESRRPVNVEREGKSLSFSFVKASTCCSLKDMEVDVTTSIKDDV
jgi:hypothetical protein